MTSSQPNDRPRAGPAHTARAVASRRELSRHLVPRIAPRAAATAAAAAAAVAVAAKVATTAGLLTVCSQNGPVWLLAALDIDPAFVVGCCTPSGCGCMLAGGGGGGMKER